jgi:hypothetical protein
MFEVLQLLLGQSSLIDQSLLALGFVPIDAKDRYALDRPHDGLERVVSVDHCRLLYYSSCHFMCIIAFLIVSSI